MQGHLNDLSHSRGVSSGSGGQGPLQGGVGRFAEYRSVITREVVAAGETMHPAMDPPRAVRSTGASPWDGSGPGAPRASGSA